MNYKAVHIVLDKDKDKELFIALLSALGFEGFEEKEKELVAYISEMQMPEVPALEEVVGKIPYRIEEIPDQNWNALWESNYPAVLLDGFCGIRADFHPYFKDVQYEITINPRMSFGTGHHATTKLMMRMMKDVSFIDKKVLDFGTGTAVLSILASKMGAKSVIAVENDPNAVENARDNILKNSISNVDVLCDDNLGAVENDKAVVLANITKNIILEHAEEMSDKIVGKGDLLLSGLMEKDEGDITSVFEKKGFKLLKRLQDDAWIGLHFTIDSSDYVSR